VARIDERFMKNLWRFDDNLFDNKPRTNGGAKVIAVFDVCLCALLN